MARDSGPCALSFAQGSFAETISFPGMSLMSRYWDRATAKQSLKQRARLVETRGQLFQI